MTRKTRNREERGATRGKKKFKDLLRREITIDPNNISEEDESSDDDYMVLPKESFSDEDIGNHKGITMEDLLSELTAPETPKSEVVTNVPQQKSAGSKHDGLDNYNPNKLVGFENSGMVNLCFFNAVFQVLYHIPAFRNYFYNNELNSQVLPKGLPREVFQSLSSGTTVSSVDIIRNYMKELNLIDYTIGQQFDAHEFLQQLLNVYYPLKELGGSSIFQAKVRGEIYCTCPQGAVGKGTNTPLIKYETNHILQLPVSSSHISVSSILQAYQDLYPLEDYPCPSCKGRGNCSQQDFVEAIDGEVLILQLKLFDYDSNQKNVIKKKLPNFKLEHALDFYGKWCLHGLVYHHGETPRSGHYTCRINVSDNWFAFNDSTVYQENHKDILEERGKVPYLIFYKKIDDNDSVENQKLAEQVESFKIEITDTCNDEIELCVNESDKPFTNDDPLSTYIKTLEDTSCIFEGKPTDDLEENGGSGHIRKCPTLQEVDEYIRQYEDETGTQYFKRKSNGEYGKDVSCVKLHKHKIYFKDTQSSEECFRMESDGTPFIVLGSSYRECKHGRDHHKRSKEKYKEKAIQDKESDHCFRKSKKSFQSSVKADCPSRIKIRDVLFFPDSRVSSTSSNRLRSNVSQALKEMTISSVNYSVSKNKLFTPDHFVPVVQLRSV